MARHTVNLKTIAIISVCVIFVLVSYFERRHELIHRFSKQRPTDFPAVLLPPENALEIEYTSPSTSRFNGKGIYVLRYRLNQPHPADEFQAWINESLSSQGWVRPKHSLLNPQYRTSSKWYVKETTTPGRDFLVLHTEWINPKREVIDVLILYRYPAEGPKDLDTLYVNQTLFDDTSWIKKSVNRYLDLYPEEFPFLDPNSTGK